MPESVPAEEDHALRLLPLVCDAAEQAELPPLSWGLLVIKVSQGIYLHPTVVSKVKAPQVIAVVFAAMAETAVDLKQIYRRASKVYEQLSVS